ncbi:GABBR2 [Symbiodinium sp. CCMP2592]|nr:GABBR2 [Symbiodinium sp. CCMP2592]
MMAVLAAARSQCLICFWPWLLLVHTAKALLCPEMCSGATTDGQSYPCRYYSNNCEIHPTPNPARNAAQDLNVLVMLPYTGPIGNTGTMAEPLLLAATQEIEDSNMLPGYRLKLHMVDEACSGQIAVHRVIEAMNTAPQKHILLGCDCSASSQPVNHAIYHYKIMQVSPFSISVDLSDRDRYPYFSRMAPSYRVTVMAAVEILKNFQVQRLSFVHGTAAIFVGLRDLFREAVQRDTEAGTYAWTVLFEATVTDLNSAAAAVDLRRQRDAKWSVLASYEDHGAMVLCQAYRHGMLAPDYNWLLLNGWWNPNFINANAGSSMCPCAADEVLHAAWGMIGFTYSPLTETNEVHGLSGRRFADITADYYRETAAFGNGTGISWNAMGYVYDGLWQIASVLHGFLIDQNRSYDELNTDFSRDSLYQLTLQQDYLGSSGRVRLFNGVDPTTTPPSFGDREGAVLMLQVAATVMQPFEQLGIWTPEGVQWLRDITWSRTDSSKSTSCSSGTCDVSTGFLPVDRSSECPAGTIWFNTLGCSDCPAGRFAALGMTQCDPCVTGAFSNVSGLAECYPCPAGSISEERAADSCSSCQQGFFVNQSGMSHCDKCKEGTYADKSGLTQCQECPAGRTTNYEGALDAAACTCNGQLWNGECFRCADGTRFELGACVQCQSGLECEEDEEPTILPGFFATQEAPYDIYKCLPADKCPGGVPGACSGGRVGVPCTQCPDGMSLDQGLCAPCAGGSFAGWVVFAIVGMSALVAMYYLINSPATTRASAMLATTCVLGMTISMLQSVGIVGMISFEWPPELSWVFDAMNFFLLDIDSMGFDCVAGDPTRRYAYSAVALPVALLWLLTAHVISRRCAPYRLQFQLPKTISTMGQVVQVAFTIASKTALQPMMCYAHPNGKHGMLSHNGIFCFESPEHTTMFLMGVALLCGLIGFYSLAIWATVHAPRAAKQSNATFLTSVRFLIARFRVDVWWYGTAVLPRGLALSLSIVLAADYPFIQMVLIVAILQTYLVVQLMTWPWKLPALNLFDCVVSVCLVMMMVCMGAFTPDLPSEMLDILTNLSIGIMVLLQVVVLSMIGVTTASIYYRHAVGSAQESRVLALGKVPDPVALAKKLSTFSNVIKDLSSAEMVKVLESLSIYDLRMTSAVMTAVGAEAGEADLMLASRVSMMSRSSRRSVSDADLGRKTSENGAKAESLPDPTSNTEDIEESKPEPFARDGPTQNVWL